MNRKVETGLVVTVILTKGRKKVGRNPNLRGGDTRVSCDTYKDRIKEYHTIVMDEGTPGKGGVTLEEISFPTSNSRTACNQEVIYVRFS